MPAAPLRKFLRVVIPCLPDARRSPESRCSVACASARLTKLKAGGNDLSSSTLPSAQIGPAIHVQGLAREVARARTAQEAHRGGHVVGRAARAGQRMMGGMMLRLGAGARRADQAWHH